MKTERFLRRVAVYILLEKDAKVLLLRRFNTGWMDGYYTLPAGHVEGGESAMDAAIREAKEETGVDVQRQDLRFVHMSHRYSTDIVEYIDIFFKASTWSGEPHTAEPDKSDDVSWFPIDALPEKTLNYVRHAIESYPKGEAYAETDWDKKAA